MNNGVNWLEWTFFPHKINKASVDKDMEQESQCQQKQKVKESVYFILIMDN